MTARAYLAILLNNLNLDNFIQTANEETAIVTIAALTNQNWFFDTIKYVHFWTLDFAALFKVYYTLLGAEIS